MNDPTTKKRTRKRTSILWTTSKEDLTKIVQSSTTMTEILKHFGFINHGSMYKVLKDRLIADNIDFNHIPVGRFPNKGRKFIIEKIPLDKILVKNSTYNRTHLKKRLIEDKIIEYKCAECNLGPIWNNKKLSIQIDHINGVSDDNRIENLRFLCPNCHSQTNNFAGKNSKKSVHIKE